MESIRIPRYLWINYPLSNYPWYPLIHAKMWWFKKIIIINFLIFRFKRQRWRGYYQCWQGIRTTKKWLEKNPWQCWWWHYQRSVKIKISSWCGQISQKKNRIFSRISALASKEVKSKKNMGTLYRYLVGGFYFDSLSLLFWFDLFLEARAEIQEKNSLVFWSKRCTLFKSS